ncbi:glycoside hydrolase family 2 TIM barrel-domain containing protein [Paraglaciecola sp. L3A3]|uniref:glycoside hydrolase family 2 TIM barrel-domain containing protein n=1 Tax=Paraglaciecola sp. L3A3 TaxID=2686358 RepID=UPI00131C77EF|nr:glycoside hydrolase family 2 TIM barrel-domain containing protein [Paraglaciecola sp. L3A3]
MKSFLLVLLIISSFLSVIRFSHADNSNYLSSTQALPFGFPKTDRTKHLLNQSWKFYRGQADAKFYTSEFDDSAWETVTIPHTLALTSLTLDGVEDQTTQLSFHRDVGWYRKNFRVTSDPVKKVFLEFEGVHQVTDVWVNGQHVGQNSVGGYTPFHFDISEFVNRGQLNQLTILADNRRSEIVPPDPGPFDFVKFSGLYRDVYLVETNPVYVTFNWETMYSGVNITTPTIDPVNKNATINIKTAVKNTTNQSVDSQLVTRIIDQEGIVVLKLITQQLLQSGQEFQFNQIGSLEDKVHLWDTVNPYLYRVNSVVNIAGETVDFVENKIGLRKFELDPEQGFMLNDKPIELIGYNRHQQYPYIGDAVPNSLHYKDMLQFKQFGFNVVRTAHYPQDDALLKACDELGILVYEEAPTWISISKNPTWWDNLEQAARVMVRNHRNHPSVVIWGAGINHRGYAPRLHNAVKQEDSVRLTSSQGARWTGWQSSGLTDINATMMFGPVLWDRSEPLLGMEGERGAHAVAPHLKDPKMLGLISWTAHAYHTFHPRHEKAKSEVDRTRAGMMTFFRYPRPRLHWYKSEFVDKPFISINGVWQKGVESLLVYSNAEQVSLELDGVIIAKAKPSQLAKYDGLTHPPFHFDHIDYQPGKLVAKGTFADGSVVEAIKSTPSEAFEIKLEADTAGRDFVADGSDVLMVYAHILDKNGMLVEDFAHKVKFTVIGDATVIGDHSNINANPMFTEYGVAPVMIRAGSKAGNITIIAEIDNLKPAKVEVTLSEHDDDMIRANAAAIYDYKVERVDIGAPDQFIQFGWQGWLGTEQNNSAYQFKAWSNTTAQLSTPSKQGIIRWLGEMNVVGKYGFAYGDGVIALDKKGLNLTFSQLPKGIYKLNTWHHAPESNSDSMDPNRDKLKTLTINKLPFANTLTVQSKNIIGPRKQQTKVTHGKQMQWQTPGLQTVVFKSDGKNPVTINYQGKENDGVWLNAFELTEWHSE